MEDLSLEYAKGQSLLVGRSPEWYTLRTSWIKRNPVCRCCGHKGVNLNVHHIKPYHLFPELELDESNLITLCEGGPLNCHYIAGHGAKGWQHYIKDVEGSIKALQKLLASLQCTAI